MDNSLQRLVDMAILAAEADSESVGLEFTGCSFSAYSKHSSSRQLQSLVGLTVQSISHVPHKSLSISLSAGEHFTVSLAPSEYVGPEAYCARFTEGPWVVE